MKWNETEEKEIPNGFRVAPEGRYPMRVIEAQAGRTSIKDLEEVKLRLAIEGHSEELDGISAFEHLVLEGKAAPYTKTKLRQLGITDEAAEGMTREDGTIDPEQLAQVLDGQLVFADLRVEVVRTKDETGKLVTKMDTDANGREIPAKTNRVKAFYAIDVGGASVATAPVEAPEAEESAAPPAGPPKAPKAPRAGAKATAEPPKLATFPPNASPPWTNKGKNAASARK